MMDTVILDDCCCDDHKPDQNAKDKCKKSHCDSMLEPVDDPCCERSIEVGIDQEAVQTVPLTTLTDLRADIDPPQTLASSFDAVFPPNRCLIHGNSHYLPVAGQSGSDTYLVTQRLRI